MHLLRMELVDCFLQENSILLAHDFHPKQKQMLTGATLHLDVLCTTSLMEGVYARNKHTCTYSYLRMESQRHLPCIWTLVGSRFILFGHPHEGVGIVAVQDGAVWCKEGHLHWKPGHEKINCCHTAQLSCTLQSQVPLKYTNHIKICRREASTPTHNNPTAHNVPATAYCGTTHSHTTYCRVTHW